MLHKPDTLEALGKFQSSDARYAALKCASREHSRILLRQTNTRLMYEYEGKIVDLDTPKEISRGDPPRVIRYTKKPVVRFVRKYLLPSDVAAGNDDDDDDARGNDE